MPRPHAVRRQTSVTRASRSKARLLDEPTRRDSWRSHVHCTYTAQRVQSFKLQTANVGGRGDSLAFSWGSKGGLLSRERRPPFDPPRERQGRFDLAPAPLTTKREGPCPPFWIIHPALLTAQQCRARTQSAARLPSLAPHGVRRGCWMNRPAGTRGEATYTALTLRSACSHSSCKLPMLGVEGTPRVLLGGPRGLLSRERRPL